MQQNDSLGDGLGSSLPVNLRPARWRTNVLLGSTVQRPVIVLAASTPGFGDRTRPRNVLKLHNTGRENDHMNQIVRSVVAGGETVILLHPPPPSVGVSIWDAEGVAK